MTRSLEAVRVGSCSGVVSNEPRPRKGGVTPDGACSSIPSGSGSIPEPVPDPLLSESEGGRDEPTSRPGGAAPSLARRGNPWLQPQSGRALPGVRRFDPRANESPTASVSDDRG